MGAGRACCRNVAVVGRTIVHCSQIDCRTARGGRAVVTGGGTIRMDCSTNSGRHGVGGVGTCADDAGTDELISIYRQASQLVSRKRRGRTHRNTSCRLRGCCGYRSSEKRRNNMGSIAQCLAIGRVTTS